MSAVVQKKVCIQNDLGLHLRAAGVLVQVAARFQSEIRIWRGDTEANAKSIMSVLSLAASKGIELTLVADGEDAHPAIEALVAVIEGGFTPS